MSRDLPRDRSSLIPLLITGTLLLAALSVAGYAWYDHLESKNSTVAGNVSFAGERLDGDDEQSVEATVNGRKDELLSKTVEIETPTGEVSYQLRDLGFTFHEGRAKQEILEARHEGSGFQQFAMWIATAFTPIEIADPIDYDRDAAIATMRAEPGLRFSNPVEPNIELTDDGFLVATIGSDGLIADLEDLADKLAEVDPDSPTIRLSSESTAIPPKVSEAESSAVVDAVNEATRGGATILVNGQSTTLTPAELRSHITASIVEGELVAGFNTGALQTTIEGKFPGPVGEPQLPTFDVAGDSVAVRDPGFPGDVCCEPTTAATLAEAILNGAAGPFNVRAKAQTDPALIALYDGSLITSRVSSFSTPHQCCENRVRNIQLMADIVRGYYLIPGEVLSLNAYVGPRTPEKGFVPAGAIRQGRLTPEVGGGVSQFATTIFNAAYFAGLDIDEYQAHSEYFDRYPRGREATMGYPSPDLKFTNNTPYGILIWTSYTSTSLTVTIYSTPYATAEQTGISEGTSGQCRTVTTTRTRTFPDGHTEDDKFRARYRPGEGQRC